MNWTGGSLQRMKQSHGHVIEKQKAYFARARTQLQQEANPNVAPFRPSYLCASEDKQYLNQFSLVEAGLNRDIGHAATPGKRGLYTSSGQIPHDQNREQRTNAQDFCDISHQQEIGGVTQTVGNMTHGRKRILKHSTTNPDEDHQLLSRSRRRLLQRCDWVGVSPSKAVDLPVLPPTREKNITSKWSKTEVKPDRSTRPREAALEKRHQSVVKRDVSAKLQIQSGTKAFVGDESEPIHECHDDMLFGLRVVTDVETFQPSELGQPIDYNSRPNAALGASRQNQIRTAQYEPSITNDRNDHSFNFSPSPVESPSPSSPEQNEWEEEEPAKVTSEQMSTCRMGSLEEHKFVPEDRVTCRNRLGIQQSPRLVFSDSSVSGDKDCREVARYGDSMHTANERTHVHIRPFVETVRRGRREEGKRAVKHAAREIISLGDGEPWESVLPISSEGSGHRAIYPATQPRSSVSPVCPKVRNDRKSVTGWSQLATQGDETLSSSKVSASLPSVRRGSGRPASTDDPITDNDILGASTRRLQKAQEDEQLWQAFVLGGDITVSSPRMETNTCSVSLPAAVSPIQAPTDLSRRRLFSNHAEWKRDEIQPAGNMAPPSPPRQSSPPIIERSSQDKFSIKLAPHRVNANLPPGWVQMVEGIRATARDSVPRGRNRCLSVSSMHAMPSSDDNLDLVDAQAKE